MHQNESHKLPNIQGIASEYLCCGVPSSQLMSELYSTGNGEC